MNGGLLIQDVDHHATFGTHLIINAMDPSERYEITSTHHQMQYPFNLVKYEEYMVLYYAQRRSTYYDGDGVDCPPSEPEVVLYTVKDKPTCLAIQGHPEIMRHNPVHEMLNKLIDKYVK